MNKRIYRLGVIGLGEGRSILHAATHNPRYEVAAVCDLDAVRCQERCQEFGLTRWTLRYEDLLADPSIDIIAIYTPDPLHADHVIAALRAGKHVICTKPVVPGLACAREVWDAWQGSDRLFLGGYSSRFFDTTMQQRADVLAGRFGDILTVEAHYHGDKRGSMAKRWGRGGAVNWLYTGLAHPADLVLWHLGRIEEVTGFARLSPAAEAEGQKTPDMFHFVCRAASGALGLVSGCYGCASGHSDGEPPVCCIVRGTKGHSQADFPIPRAFSNVDGEGVKMVYQPERLDYYFPWKGFSYHAGEFRNYLQHFAECLDSGAAPSPSLAESLQGIALLDSMAEAAGTKRVVKVADVLKRHGLETLPHA